jgi:hypothetical protein
MMDTDRTFYTATMAGLYAEQGNLARAVMIYRHLLNQSPQREDLAQALAEAEARLAARDPYDLVDPIRRWAQLALRQGRTAALTRIRRRLHSRARQARLPSRNKEKS